MTKILIADDNSDNLYMLSTVLKSFGYEAELALNGKQALEAARKSPPALIISDILMPVMDGFKLCQEWKSDDNLRMIPFIFYTATYTEAKDKDFALSLGAERFIVKPQTPDKLILMIQEVMERAARGEAVKQAPPKDKAKMIEEYSEVLFRKLEKKVADLERETALRKEAETETLRHCMTLDTVIENAAGPICSVDDSYRYTSFNKAHALYMKFKYGVDIEPGKNIVDYVGDKEDTEGLVDGIKKALVGETTVAEYSTLIEGHERFFEVTYGPIKAKGGPFVGVVVSGYDITDRKMAEDRLAHNYSELEEALHGLVNALAATVKTRDPYTALHQKNVSQLAEAIALKMGLSEDKARSLGLAGLVHDVGKIHVPGEVLNKPGVLSQTEYELVKTHPEAAFAILKDIKFKDDVAVMIRQHHERLDGSGYPEGITGKDMLLGSKIMAVADVVAAMTSPRPYRAAFKIEDALKEIRDNRENLYDPTVVDACVELFEEDGFVFSESEY